MFDLVKKNLLKKKKYIKMFYFIKCLTIIHPIFVVVLAMLFPTSRWRLQIFQSQLTTIALITLQSNNQYRSNSQLKIMCLPWQTLYKHRI